MGEPKLLALLGGRPLVRWAVEAAQASRADEVLVVVGANARATRDALVATGVHCVENPGWEAGLASSIHCGLEAAGEPDAVLLILADQPAVTPAVLDALVEKHRSGHALAACEYTDGTVGPPALLGRIHFEALRVLEGDRGAHAIVRSGEPELVQFSGGTFDVDTPEDLARVAAERLIVTPEPGARGDRFEPRHSTGTPSRNSPERAHGSLKHDIPTRDPAGDDHE